VGAGRVSNSIYQRFFTLILFYYWVRLTFIPGGTPEAGSLAHIAIVAPIGAYTALSLYLLARSRQKKSLSILLGALLACLVSSMANLDVRAAIGIFVFILPVYALIDRKVTIKINVLNNLYLITFIYCVISYHAGFNDYGYMPWYTESGGGEWRVNLFPYATPPYSAAFSLLVIIGNVYASRMRRSNLIIVVLALYFVLLSGNRTSLIILISIPVIHVLIRWNFRFLLKVYPIGVVIVVLLSLILPSYLLMYDTPQIVNYAIYRSPEPPPITEIEGHNRILLMSNLYSIYSTSPIFGVGSFDIYSYFPDALSHSESKWMSLLAGYGIGGVLVFAFFYYRYMKAIDTNVAKNAVIIFSMIIYCMFYGSMFNTYNFIMLLLIALISIEQSHRINDQANLQLK